MSGAPSLGALIGASLLAAGRPVQVRELAAVLGVPEDAALREVQAFTARVQAADLGFTVEAVAGGYRLVVPPTLSGHLAPLLAPPPLPALSSAALEVLAVIAYRQPVTRAEIEAMRGGSAGTVVTLQERELVKVVGRSDAVGSPLLYGTTERFLLDFGLTGLDELPPLENANFSHLLRS
ncbi:MULTISPECIES: SMC-Scp complex subunit ScpB [Deinococcus]|jgi:segregation and condensation protein B|uniref:Segregation and condensation protein B homolog n=1 Tax=Deinococcus caeni TaxID=569127 RepID=A0ABP9UDR5_9DEIO|nr:SMC-Scp complex subunit ScpB [Deinococcus indicus]GHG14411.1 segregation and condensation protein B [Deinococcus indicus]